MTWKFLWCSVPNAYCSRANNQERSLKWISLAMTSNRILLKSWKGLSEPTTARAKLKKGTQCNRQWHQGRRMNEWKWNCLHDFIWFKHRFGAILPTRNHSQTSKREEVFMRILGHIDANRMFVFSFVQIVNNPQRSSFRLRDFNYR